MRKNCLLKKMSAILLAGAVAVGIVPVMGYVSTGNIGAAVAYASDEDYDGENVNWDAFNVTLKPRTSVSAGKTVTFDLTIENLQSQTIKTDIYAWYYRDDDDDGMLFGDVTGNGYTPYEEEGGYVSLDPKQILNLTLTGTVPATWDGSSSILVVADAYDAGYMGQAEYSTGIDISDAEVTMRPSSTKTYNGKEQKLATGDVIVTYGNKTLVEGKDYRLENVDEWNDDYKSPGTHVSLIKGIGEYRGWNYAPYIIQFKDMPNDSKNPDFDKAIIWALDWEITTGYLVNGKSDGTFRPWNSINRAAVVTFLWRANECPDPKSIATFKDMPADTPANHDFRMAISWAAEQGITTGYSDGTFRPWENCNRAAIATFIWRATGNKTTAKSAGFKDMTGNSDFDKAISWGVANGIIKGFNDNTFRPWNNCNRAATVTFLYRYYND